MSKAIRGMAELAGAVGMGALMALEASTGVGIALIPLEMHAMESLVALGISTELGAIAQALGSSQGMGVTTRQPASLRQIIRGVQRVGGVIVYNSTTGGTHRQYNMVIVLATHACHAIENLYLDGRQVFWSTGSAYNQTVNGYNFGGDAASGSHTGPNGVQYDFGGKVFCAAFQGKQTNAPTVVSGAWVGPSTISDATASYPGFCSALEANDANWSPQAMVIGRTATASAVVGVSNSIASIGISDPGQGYADSTSVGVTITDSGGGSGYGATAHGIASGGGLTSIVVDSPGVNYTAPVVTVDPPATSTNTPYLGGCTYVYLKLEADSGTFPQFPQIRFTVHGKNDIYDPRTSTRGFTTNWALHIADAITDPAWGLGDPTVNQAQLIAAANVCDELVNCAGGAEARYALNYKYDTGTAPGDAIQQMMSAAAGRLSRVGGEWFIWPAYWQGPSLSFDENDFLDAPQWTPRRPMGELCNRVTGMYTAPNFPFNVAGNLYDSNGFFQGMTQNNFPYSFQPSSVPMYAADALHGYGEDVYLIADTPNLGNYSAAVGYNTGDVAIYGGVPWQANETVPAGNAPGTLDGSGNPYWSATGNYLPQDLSLPGVLSISQAQRLFKIHMLRNRQQGSGTLTMKLSAYLAQPIDVVQVTFSPLGWLNKQLEIAAPSDWAMKLLQGQVGQGDEAPLTYVQVRVQETDSSVYEWDQREELTPYDVPATTSTDNSYIVAAPTNVNITNDASTALVLQDGTSIARALVTWTPPADTYVANGGSIEVQYRLYDQTGFAGPIRALALGTPTYVVGGVNLYATDWVDAAKLSGIATYFYIDLPSGYGNLSVQLRAVRSNGATSVWVQDTLTLGNNPRGITRPVPLLTKQSLQVPGTTVNPAVGTAYADLPELGASDAPMTVTLKGNPVLASVHLAFVCNTGSGGAVTGIGIIFVHQYGGSAPSISIAISGDGTGASASVTWTYTAPYWWPTVSITGGSGYTYANSIVTVYSYSALDPGTYYYSCSISSLTPVSGQQIAVQVLMDGAQVIGPAMISTDANGDAVFNATQLITPGPSAGSHVFRVQTQTSSSDTITSTSRSFQLVELA